MTQHTWRWTTTAAAITIGIACAPSVGRGEGAPAPTSQGAVAMQTIDHLAPRRDSTGPPPPRFEWTPVQGADSYAIGVWNEVDMLLWKQGGLREPAVDRPAALDLGSGTYLWSVVALKDGRQIADSGLAAFVVMR